MMWLGWMVFFVWLVTLFKLVPFLRDRRLDVLSADSTPTEGFPNVSVIVPARDEEQDIESCLTSLLAVDYPELEIIAVNDRSQDATGAIMDRLAEGDSRLKVVHVDSLPEGWLGKNHAMHRGVEAAHGDYLLFTDGDVQFGRSVLKKAVNHVLTTGIDLLCLIPGALNRGYFETAFKCFFLFGLLLYVQPDKIRSNSRGSYIGIGAFNMIRNTTYRQLGGHVPLRFEIVDDLMLGKMVKDNGFRQDLLIAPEELKLRWHDGVWNIFRGVEKNIFASMEFSLVKSVLASVAFLFHILPYAGLFLIPDPASYGFLLSLLISHSLFGYLLYSFGENPHVHFAMLFGAVMELAAMWNSIYKTLKQGGVRWRDTFYSIEQLRKNSYLAHTGKW